MALILEVLDRRSGAVRVRVPADRLPLTIGRGLHNDLVIEDPYADAAHAHVTADDDGATVVQDLGSLNRLVLAATGERVDRVVAAAGMELRIGRTPIRFRDPREVVPPALPDAAPAAGRLRWLNTTGAKLAAIGGVTGAFWLHTWLSSYERSGASDAFAVALGVAILAAVWAGVWAVGGRVVTHRFHFVGHMALVCLALSAAILLGEITSWGDFLFPDHSIWPVLGAVAGLATLAALLAWHLRLASGMARRRRWVTGVIVAGLVFGLGSVAILVEQDDFSDVPEFSAVLKPAGWVPTITPAEFRDVASELRLQVDDLRAQMDERARR